MLTQVFSLKKCIEFLIEFWSNFCCILGAFFEQIRFQNQGTIGTDDFENERLARTRCSFSWIWGCKIHPKINENWTCCQKGSLGERRPKRFSSILDAVAVFGSILVQKTACFNNLCLRFLTRKHANQESSISFFLHSANLENCLFCLEKNN